MRSAETGADGMRIDYCEEYPTSENLSRAAGLPQGTVVFLAAQTEREFRSAAEVLRNHAPGAVAGWWPILPESYWVSSWSGPEELEALARALDWMPRTHILIDAELPFVRPRRFIIGLPQQRRARKALRKLHDASNRHDTVFATYPVMPGWAKRLFGVPTPGTPLFMHYTSMMPAWLARVSERSLRRRKRKDAIVIGLGTLSPGVFGKEPTLPPERLSHDLDFCRGIGCRRVVLYRLGGLTSAHRAVLRTKTT